MIIILYEARLRFVAKLSNSIGRELLLKIDYLVYFLPKSIILNITKKYIVTEAYKLPR